MRRGSVFGLRRYFSVPVTSTHKDIHIGGPVTPSVLLTTLFALCMFSFPLLADGGLTINGALKDDQSGYSVSGAGDVNGDGYDDVIVSAPNADPGGRSYAGTTYIIYGGPTISLSPIELASLTASQGVKINGALAYDWLGRSVSNAGDVNGDGYADVIINARYSSPGPQPDTGITYIIYGGPAMPATIELASLKASQGVKINGALANDMSGYSVSYAGDVNKDGYDDVIIGAIYASPGGRTMAGTTYIIYGGASMPLTIELASLTATQGVKINGELKEDQSGYSVSYAGDVNGDGYDDVIIGAYLADLPTASGYGQPGLTNTGTTYIIYGGPAMPLTIELASLTATQGVKINGDSAGDNSGWSVSYAGDVNGDGYDDVIIGAPYADPGGRTSAGKTYIVYGNATMPATIDLDTLAYYAQGAQIDGAALGDRLGHSVSYAGDVNKDGYDDVIIGAPGADEQGLTYIIYGNATMPANRWIDLASLTASQGVKINGALTGDRLGYSVSNAGDVNDDGYDDVIIGAYLASPGGLLEAGRSYVFSLPTRYCNNGTSDPAACDIVTTSAGFFANCVFDANHTLCVDSSTCTHIKADGTQCVTACASNEYMSDKQCTACDASCATCVNVTECDTCKTGLIYDVSHALCVDSSTCTYIKADGTQCVCASNEYLSGKQCTACHASCATCVNGATCDTCKTGLIYDVSHALCVDSSICTHIKADGTQCVAACASHEYLSGKQCTACHASCATCTDLSTCTSCPDGYTLVGSECKSSSSLIDDDKNDDGEGASAGVVVASVAGGLAGVAAIAAGVILVRKKNMSQIKPVESGQHIQMQTINVEETKTDDTDGVSPPTNSSYD